MTTTPTAANDIDDQMASAEHTLHAAIATYQESVWPWVRAKVLDAFPEATECWFLGEYSEQTGELTLRLGSLWLQGVGVVGVGDETVADLADEVDPKLDWLATLTGEDYLGWVKVTLPDGGPEWVDEQEVP